MDLRIDRYDKFLNVTEKLSKQLDLPMSVLSEDRLGSVWTNARDCLRTGDLVGSVAAILEGFVRRPPVLHGESKWTRENWEQMDRASRISVQVKSASASQPLAFALAERIAWLNGCTIFQDDDQVERLACLYEQLISLWSEHARSNYAAESFQFNDIDHEAGVQWPNELVIFDAFRILVSRMVGQAIDGQVSLLGWEIPPVPEVRAVVSFPMQAIEGSGALSEKTRLEDIEKCFNLLGIESVFPERTIGDRSIDVRQRNLRRTLDSDIVLGILDPASIGVSINIAWGQSCAGFVVVAGSSVSPMLDSLNTVRIASSTGPSMVNQLLAAVVQGWPLIESSANARPRYRNSLGALSTELCEALDRADIPFERREWVWGIVSEPIVLASLPPRQLITLGQMLNIDQQELLARVARDLGKPATSEPSPRARPPRPKGLASQRPRSRTVPEKVHFSRSEEEALEQCAKIHHLSHLEVHRMTLLAAERKIEAAGRTSEAAKLTFANAAAWVPIWHDSQKTR